MPDMKKKFKRKDISLILDKLSKAYPEAGCALEYDNKFHLLIAVVLSAQTTDVGVNKVTPRLWARYPDSAALAHADRQEVEKIISSIGLYRSKAKNIISLSKSLQERLSKMSDKDRSACKNSPDNKDGVPSDFDELVKLSGVGRKTANVVLAEGFGEQRMPVDTHVFRVSNRIGMSSANDVFKTEEELKELIPYDRLTESHHLLIWHGRKCCSARKPDCLNCPVFDHCNTGDFFLDIEK